MLGVFVGCSTTGTPPGNGDDTPEDGGGGLDGGTDAPPIGPSLQLPDPDHGPFRGGTTVNLRGQGFRNDDEVFVGGRMAIDKRFIDSRRMEIVTPPGEPGDADVEIRRGGATFLVREDAYHFDQIAVDPPNGSTAGGTFVTITGWETEFDATTVVTFDGVPLSALTVLNPGRLTGITPPGTAGDADVFIRTSTNNYSADRAYTYRNTGDSFSGGFGGPPLSGTINISVIDNTTKNGIPNAFVALGDPNTTMHKGRTNALGQITFSGPDIVGPQRVVAWEATHEVGTFDCVDSQDVSIWLRSPIPPPGDPVGSVGPNGSFIKGQLMFGDAVGLGSPFWNLVPEPRRPTERKRIYVTTTAPTLTSNPIPPLMAIDYTFDPQRLSWPFEVQARPGATGVVAIAGLYDSAQDPTGRGVQGFEPFAAGVARGVLVGPGETKTGVDVIVNIPLDAAMRIKLDHPPPLGGPNQPVQVRLRGGVDLGGEGTVHFGKHGLIPDPNLPFAGETLFPIGTTTSTILDLPALARGVADGSYGLQVGAYNQFGGAPFSVRMLSGLHDNSAPITVGDFVGVPQAIDPFPSGGPASGRHLQFQNEGDVTGRPTFHIHMLYNAVGDPLYRGITCESMRDVPLPDLSSVGHLYPQSGQSTIWVAWSIAATGQYRDFNYRWLGIAYWRAYASNSFTVQFP